MTGFSGYRQTEWLCFVEGSDAALPKEDAGCNDLFVDDMIGYFCEEVNM